MYRWLQFLQIIVVIRNTPPYQKEIIAGAIGSGLTPSRVQKAFRVPESSVRYVLSKAHNIDGHAAPRSGRPKKLSTRDERHILRIVRRDPKITYKELIRRSGVAVSDDTIYRLLKEEGIINWIAKKTTTINV